MNFGSLAPRAGTLGRPLRPVRPMKLIRFFLPLLLLPAAAAAQPAAAPAAPAVQPGDMLRISVWRKDELSGEFYVAADSSISHPFYAELKVVGLPIAAVQEMVRRYVERFESNPRVLVQPLFRVTVGGEVRQPNLYNLRPETTVAQAVALAGGSTDRGTLRRVTLLRAGRGTPIDLTLPDTGPGQMPVQSGDQILVGRRENVFRDYVVPSGSIVAAIAALLNIAIRK